MNGHLFSIQNIEKVEGLLAKKKHLSYYFAVIQKTLFVRS